MNCNNFDFNNTPEDYLLFLGRIHPDKGTAEAIEIAKRSKRRLIIAGIVQDSGYFNEKIKPMLNTEIQYIGSVGPAEKNILLGKACALLHPILFNEPFGLSVAEAMLCGTPVIAYNKGSMPELINNGKTGFLVKNVDQAVQCVNELKYIDRINCHEWAITKFSMEKMVADYLQLYELILANEI